MGETKPVNILAIETGVTGGSLAFVTDGKTTQRWVGQGNTSRAEDLLVAIDEMFRGANREIGRPDRIAVSVGPGSFTGLRIGIAKAMGLAKGLGIPLQGVRLLNAMARLAGEENHKIAAIPMGKSDCCYQRFREDTTIIHETESVPLDRLADAIGELSEVTIVLHSRLIPLFPPSYRDRVIDAGDCLAVHVGALAIAEPASSNIEPIYVQNRRFG